MITTILIVIYFVVVFIMMLALSYMIGANRTPLGMGNDDAYAFIIVWPVSIPILPIVYGTYLACRFFRKLGQKAVLEEVGIEPTECEKNKGYFLGLPLGIELKKCKICGGEAAIGYKKFNGDVSFWIACTMCYAKTLDGTVSRAADSWNKDISFSAGADDD